MNSLKILPKSIGKDALTGLTAAIAASPDGMVAPILVPRGNLFCAAAKDFEEEAPAPDDAQSAVVIINLCGRLQVGSTFMGVLGYYSQALQVLGADSTLPTSSLYLGSLQSALDAARKWLTEEVDQGNTE